MSNKNEYNMYSPISNKNPPNNNQYKSIESASNRVSNRPLKKNIELSTPLSSLSNYYHLIHNPLVPPFELNEKQTNSDNYQDYQIKNLENKLHFNYKTNDELNKEFKEISEKSTILIQKINRKNKIFIEIKKNYEKSIKKNEELKQLYKNLFKKYKNENNEEDEIKKIKNEQKILLLSIQSKEKIINNLQDTLNLLKMETDKEKDDILYEDMTQKNKINELKKILNELNYKIENNKKNISFFKQKKEELINEKSSLINSNNSKNENGNKKYINSKEINNNKEKYLMTIKEYEEILKNKKEILNKKMKIKQKSN